MQPFTLPLHKACKVIEYHPSGLWAIEKANGVLSHPNPGNSHRKSLLTTAFDFNNECYCWSDETGTNRQLFLIHRLDSATSYPHSLISLYRDGNPVEGSIFKP